MATSVAPARAVPRNVAQLLSQKTPAGPKARASLIYDMHSKLYPHLYDGKIQPVHSTNEETGKVKRYLAKKTPQFDAPYYAEKAEWRKMYSDSKLEQAKKHTTKLRVHPQKTPITKTCPDPVALVTTSQIALLDPTGARTRLFSRTNPECARVGDTLLVRQRTGDPFAGVCINIRRRGADTAILLRGQLTRIGVEMWFKIYSPLVEAIEVVQRAAKRARRARLTFMRTVKHDRGSVENVVRTYLKQKASLGTAEGKKKGAGAGSMGGNKKGGKRGKKR